MGGGAAGVFDSYSVRVFETRTWQAAMDAIQDGRSNVLALECAWKSVRGGPRHCLGAGEIPGPSRLVLAERAMSECEWIVREAGAVHFTSSPRNLVPVARLATRILATHQTPTPTFRTRPCRDCHGASERTYVCQGGPEKTSRMLPLRSQDLFSSLLRPCGTGSASATHSQKPLRLEVNSISFKARAHESGP